MYDLVKNAKSPKKCPGYCPKNAKPFCSTTGQPVPSLVIYIKRQLQRTVLLHIQNKRTFKYKRDNLICRRIKNKVMPST
jgi:hypothetical protein